MELAGVSCREMNSENSFSLAKAEVYSPLMVTKRESVCIGVYVCVCGYMRVYAAFPW